MMISMFSAQIYTNSPESNRSIITISTFCYTIDRVFISFHTYLSLCYTFSNFPLVLFLLDYRFISVIVFDLMEKKPSDFHE